MMIEEQSSTVPRFFREPQQDMEASAKAGRPIYTDVEMVEVMILSDRNTRPVFIVEEKHKKLWPQAYEEFVRTGEMAVVGTPVDLWPAITKSKAYEFKAVGIMTVEQLAGIDDTAVKSLGFGTSELREKARAYINAGRDTAIVTEQAAKIARLEAMLERMEQRLQDVALPAPDNKREPAKATDDGEAEARDINSLSDAELRAYIKQETGKAASNNASRETLIERATLIAKGQNVE